MRRRVGHLVLALYPRAWRERYGEEIAALIEEEGRGDSAFAGQVGRLHGLRG